MTLTDIWSNTLFYIHFLVVTETIHTAPSYLCMWFLRHKMSLYNYKAIICVSWGSETRYCIIIDKAWLKISRFCFSIMSLTLMLWIKCDDEFSNCGPVRSNCNPLLNLVRIVWIPPYNTTDLVIVKSVSVGVRYQPNNFFKMHEYPVQIYSVFNGAG